MPQKTTNAPALAPQPKAQATEALLLTVQQVAAMLGLSRRTVFALTSSGKLPAPIRIGQRLTRWRRRDIETWAERLA